MTLDAWMRAARRSLEAIEAPSDAAREARLILAHVTGWSAARVATAGPDPLPPDALRDADAALRRRLAREPLAQIIGQWPFHGRLFRTSAATLTPRPDTETLVDIALAAPVSRLLDLGTGTGAIAVTVLAERPAASGVATDLSPDALQVARDNAVRHGVADRLDIRQSDWWSALPARAERFDLIVSNPPYVTQAEYVTLAPEITMWEPRIALTPGGDGLEPYRIIAAGAPARLGPGGRLVVEIGHRQGPAVAALFAGAGLDDVTVHPDINGKARVVSARMPGGSDG